MNRLARSQVRSRRRLRAVLGTCRSPSSGVFRHPECASRGPYSDHQSERPFGETGGCGISQAPAVSVDHARSNEIDYDRRSACAYDNVLRQRARTGRAASIRRSVIRVGQRGHTSTESVIVPGRYVHVPISVGSVKDRIRLYSHDSSDAAAWREGTACQSMICCSSRGTQSRYERQKRGDGGREQIENG